MKKKDTQDQVSKMKPKKKKVGKILGIRTSSKKKKVLVKAVTCPPKFCSSKVWREKTPATFASQNLKGKQRLLVPLSFPCKRKSRWNQLTWIPDYSGMTTERGMTTRKNYQ